MLKYIKEAEEDIKMDVQVGPQEEVEVEMEEPKCNAVDMAKKDPETVPVACVEKEGVKEFYVDAKDVAKLADMNEATMIDALNSIIACNEESGISADNLVVVMSEGTELYERNLERNGAACVHFVSESADESQEKDIEMDVQVGPNEEEISVSEDPQEANPVDAVKREYDSVVVAKDDDKFFMDVEDVQKCADLNCESVIDTINGIIGVHEDYDMNTENVVLLVNENARIDTLNMLKECGVLMEADFTFLPKFKQEPKMKKYLKDIKEAEDFLNDNGQPTKTGVQKGFRIALRVINIIQNVDALIGLPFLWTLVIIPTYLVSRALDLAERIGEEKLAEAECKKVIDTYKKALDECQDEKTKAKMQKQYDKLVKSHNEFIKDEKK